MSSPIPGVSPASVKEVTVMTVWPSIAATSFGRALGRVYQSGPGIRILGIPITLGRIVALLSIPVVLPIFFHMLVPRLPLVFFGWRNSACRRYRLTNRRVIVEQGLGGEEQRSVGLDRFDTVEIADPDRRTWKEGGQDWFTAGELVFKLKGVETFRLQGVPHPESFRQTCVKTQMSFAGVQHARERGAAV